MHNYGGVGLVTLGQGGQGWVKNCMTLHKQISF